MFLGGFFYPKIECTYGWEPIVDIAAINMIGEPTFLTVYTGSGSTKVNFLTLRAPHYQEFKRYVRCIPAYAYVG